MKYLSLFSGAGGGDLGLQHLVRLECVGYVEWDKDCCRALEQRIKDGFLADAPVFCGDIREWIKRGYAESYSGLVDVVAGGFPCQPFSVSGKRKAGSDDRNMWPATIESIRIIRPQLVFLENVPGLLSSGYAATVANDLHGAGYQVLPPLVLGAIDVGAPHKRDRVWIVAYSQGKRTRGLSIRPGRSQQAATGANGMGEDVSDAKCYRCDEMEQPIISRTKNERPAGSASDRCISGWGEWWQAEPNVGRVANGVAHRVDRLKAIGNGQVPAVVREAWRILIGGV